MKKHRLALLGLFAGLSALAVTSCAYDPYYSGTSYSGGYGSGYGYGGSNFSTSFFVNTGNPRWAYDPYAACYYDYTRRAYYDPHICGYYPVGYRPRYVVGAPHPHGWSRGSNYCPPPGRIRNYTIDSHADRAQSYRSLGRDWSRNVSVSAPTHQPRPSYGGRESQDRGVYQSRGPGFSGSQGSFPSRGSAGSSGREGADRGGFSSENPRQTGSQHSFPMNRGEDRQNGSAGTFSEMQPRERIERSPAPSPRSMERPAVPTQREFSPGGGERGGRSRSESPGSGDESPGRRRGGMRTLGDG